MPIRRDDKCLASLAETMSSYSATGATLGHGSSGSNETGGRGVPDYNLSGVLHFLQSEWRRYEHERNAWSIERAELRARIALLEGERRSVENLKTDLLRRIKMLEYALRQERMKGTQNSVSVPGNSISTITSRVQNERSQSGGPHSALYEDGQDMIKQLSSSNNVKVPLGVKDAKGRAKSRAYLQQCLQEIAYLTSNVTLNPIANQSDTTDAKGEASHPSRPLFHIPGAESSTENKNNSNSNHQIQDYRHSYDVSQTHGGQPSTSAVKSAISLNPSVDNCAQKLPESVQECKPNLTPTPDRTIDSSTENLATVPDVQLWNPRGTIMAHFDSVRSLAYDSFGHGLFTASDDCTIKYWHLLSTESSEGTSDDPVVEQLTTMRGHEAPVTCLVCSRKLNVLFSGSQDTTIRQWILPNDTPTKHSSALDAMDQIILPGNSGIVWDLALFPMNAQEDSILASVSADGMIRLWSTDAKASPRLFLSWDYFGTQPSKEADAERQSLICLPVPKSVTKCSADLKVCVVAFSNGIVKLFELSSGREVRRFNPSFPTSQVRAVVGHPTLPLVAAAYEDKYIHLYDIHTGSCTLSLQAHDQGVACLDIDPSGLTLVSGSHDGKVRFWDLLRSSESGSTSATASTSNTAASDQEYTAVCFQELSPHQMKQNEGVLNVTYHPSMPFVATAGADGTVHMYG